MERGGLRRGRRRGRWEGGSYSDIKSGGWPREFTETFSDTDTENQELLRPPKSQLRHVVDSSPLSRIRPALFTLCVEIGLREPDVSLFMTVPSLPRAVTKILPCLPGKTYRILHQDGQADR